MSSSQPIVIVQHICTDWTKRSRGGNGPIARNRVPEVYALPALTNVDTETNLLLHKVFYSEYRHFENPGTELEQRQLAEPFRYDCFRLELQNNKLQITFEWEHSRGVPRRPGFLRQGWSLQQGQWSRIIYNLRTSQDSWVYKKHVLSIGYFPTYDASTFSEGKPTHEYRDMANLW